MGGNKKQPVSSILVHISIPSEHDISRRVYRSFEVVLIHFFRVLVLFLFTQDTSIKGGNKYPLFLTVQPNMKLLHKYTHTETFSWLLNWLAASANYLLFMHRCFFDTSRRVLHSFGVVLIHFIRVFVSIAFHTRCFKISGNKNDPLILIVQSIIRVLHRDHKRKQASMILVHL